MIQRIQLEAFKSFEHLDLLLGDLTLLSGLNSSGKSSILQAFAVLRQSLDAGMLGNGSRSELLLNGPIVTLGTGGDIYCEYSRHTRPEIVFLFYGSANDSVGWRVPVENPDADVLPTEPFDDVHGSAFQTLSKSVSTT